MNGSNGMDTVGKDVKLNIFTLLLDIHGWDGVGAV